MKKTMAITALLLLCIGLAAANPWDELRDSFTALTAKVTAVEAEQAAIGTKVEGLSGAVAELKVSGQNAAAEIAKLSVRVTALEKPVPPPPIDDPDLLTAADLEYLGYFLLPGRLPDATTHQQFKYSNGVACRGPKGLFVSGHAHSTYAAETTIPEPSKTSPPRAEYIQTFVDIGAGRTDVFKDSRTGRGELRGLHLSGDRLYANFGQHYNVSGKRYPSLCWGPTELAKHASEGTPLLWVESDDGPVHSDLVAGFVAETPWGLALTNQQAKHTSRSDAPTLYVVDPPADGADKVTGFRTLLRHERGARTFPDPPNGWNEECFASDMEVIGDTFIFCGRVGLATGLPEHYAGLREQAETQFAAGEITEAEYSETIDWLDRTPNNVWYGSPDNYPVPGIDICKGPASKGWHAPPYKVRLWLYSRASIENATDPAGPLPYATIDLSTDEWLGATECGFVPGALVWLPDKEWLLLTQPGEQPRVHVLKVKRGD